MSIMSDIRDHYRYHVGHTATSGNVITAFPLSRLEFNAGATLAIIDLVEKIAKSIFFLAGTLVTLGLNDGIKASLVKNARGIIVYGGVIPLGYAGVIFPQTVNQYILQIPSESLSSSFPPRIWSHQQNAS